MQYKKYLNEEKWYLDKAKEVMKARDLKITTQSSPYHNGKKVLVLYSKSVDPDNVYYCDINRVYMS